MTVVFLIGFVVGYLTDVVRHRYKLRRYRRGTEIIPLRAR